MLRRLALRNVGPSTHLEWGPVAPRFNLVTGDNGLGKSFLLDTAWWALTRTWHEVPAVPAKPQASIEFAFDQTKGVQRDTAHWDPLGQQWKRTQGRPPNPGLIIDARVDGSFSCWDPARNHRLYTRTDGGEAQSPSAYQFTAQQVMEGLKRTVVEGGVAREQVLCSGLIDDWTPQSLRSAYHHRCAYLAMRIHPAHGAATVDHFLPKSTWVAGAYEWSNFRLAAARVNTLKALHRVIDPCAVQPGWFVLHIGTFQVEPGGGLEAALHREVQATITHLGLNDRTFVEARADYHDRYFGLGPRETGGPREPLPFPWLAEECPFVAAELARQGRLRPEDRAAGAGLLARLARP